MIRRKPELNIAYQDGLGYGEARKPQVTCPTVTAGDQSRRAIATRIFNLAKTEKSVKINLQEEHIMAKEQTNIDLYKKLICDMIQEMGDCRFLRQIYSIVYAEYKKTGI